MSRNNSSPISANNGFPISGFHNVHLDHPMHLKMEALGNIKASTNNLPTEAILPSTTPATENPEEKLKAELEKLSDSWRKTKSYSIHGSTCPTPDCPQHDFHIDVAIAGTDFINSRDFEHLARLSTSYEPREKATAQVFNFLSKINPALLSARSPDPELEAYFPLLMQLRAQGIRPAEIIELLAQDFPGVNLGMLISKHRDKNTSKLISLFLELLSSLLDETSPSAAAPTETEQAIGEICEQLLLLLEKKNIFGQHLGTTIARFDNDLLKMGLSSKPEASLLYLRLLLKIALLAPSLNPRVMTLLREPAGPSSNISFLNGINNPSLFESLFDHIEVALQEGACREENLEALLAINPYNIQDSASMLKYLQLLRYSAEHPFIRVNGSPSAESAAKHVFKHLYARIYVDESHSRYYENLLILLAVEFRKHSTLNTLIDSWLLLVEYLAEHGGCNKDKLLKLFTILPGDACGILHFLAKQKGVEAFKDLQRCLDLLKKAGADTADIKALFAQLTWSEESVADILADTLAPHLSEPITPEYIEACKILLEWIREGYLDQAITQATAASLGAHIEKYVLQLDPVANKDFLLALALESQYSNTSLGLMLLFAAGLSPESAASTEPLSEIGKFLSTFYISDVFALLTNPSNTTINEQRLKDLAFTKNELTTFMLSSDTINDNDRFNYCIMALADKGSTLSRFLFMKRGSTEPSPTKGNFKAINHYLANHMEQFLARLLIDGPQNPKFLNDEKLRALTHLKEALVAYIKTIQNEDTLLSACINALHPHTRLGKFFYIPRDIVSSTLPMLAGVFAPPDPSHSESSLGQLNQALTANASRRAKVFDIIRNSATNDAIRHNLLACKEAMVLHIQELPATDKLPLLNAILDEPGNKLYQYFNTQRGFFATEETASIGTLKAMRAALAPIPTATTGETNNEGLRDIPGNAFGGIL